MSKHTAVITVAMLRAKGACAGQVKLFTDEWPNGCPVCMESIDRCITLGISWEWAEALLTAPALAEYERVTAPALVSALLQSIKEASNE